MRLHHDYNQRHVEEIEIQSYLVAGDGPRSSIVGLAMLARSPRREVKDDKNEQAHIIKRIQLESLK